MKNEELSKRISDLECEIENIKRIVEAEGSLAKHEPSIFERFPVGSYICGMKVLNHDEDEGLHFDIEFSSGDSTWCEIDIIKVLAACHDWIEKYHPFLETYRERFEDNEINYPPTAISTKGQQVGIFGCKTPVKKPWEDA